MGDRSPEQFGSKDIVIMLLGRTGAGKSSFFDKLFPGPQAREGQGLDSCTKDVESAVAANVTGKYSRIQNHRVVIVDTPGFDDTFVEDIDTLRKVAAWLEKSCSQEVVIGGIIYLHDISAQRHITGNTKKIVMMLKRLCGAAALDRVVIVSSKSERAQCGDVRAMEAEIRTLWQSSKFTLQRWEKVAGREWEIVQSILARVEMCGGVWEPLKFQEELAKGTAVENTDAGKSLGPLRSDDIGETKKQFRRGWLSKFSFFRLFRSSKKKRERS